MTRSLNYNKEKFYISKINKINNLTEKFTNIQKKIHYNSNIEEFNNFLINDTSIKKQVNNNDNNILNYDNILRVKAKNQIDTLNFENDIQDKNININNKVLNEVTNKFENNIDKLLDINKKITIKDRIINLNKDSLENKNYKINNLVFTLILLLFVLLNIILYFTLNIYNNKFLFITINLLIFLLILLKVVVFKNKINNINQFIKESQETGKDLIKKIPKPYKEVVKCPSRCSSPTEPTEDIEYITYPATNIDSSNIYTKLGDLPEANWNNKDLYPNMKKSQIVIPNKKDRPQPYYKGIDEKNLTKYTCRWEGSKKTAPVSDLNPNTKKAFEFESLIPCSRYDNYKTVNIK